MSDIDWEIEDRQYSKKKRMEGRCLKGLTHINTRRELVDKTPWTFLGLTKRFGDPAVVRQTRE